MKVVNIFGKQIGKDNIFYYLSDALIFLNRNKKFYFIFLGIYFLIEAESIFKLFHINLPLVSGFITLGAFFSLTVFSYVLPLFFLKVYRKETLVPQWMFQVLKQYSWSLLGPFLLIFIPGVFLLVLPFVIIDQVFHLTPPYAFFPTKEVNTFIGFYPMRAFFGVVSGIVTIPFLFAPFLYSLKRQSFLTSLKNAWSFFIKEFLKLIPLTVFIVVYNAVELSLIPQGSYFLRVGSTIIDASVSIVVYVMVFFYYHKHFPIDPDALTVFSQEFPPPPVKSNVIYRRIFATIIDIILWCVIYYFALGFFGERSVTLDGQQGYESMQLVGLPLLVFLIAFLSYFVVSEWKIKGTFGKRFLGLQVLSEKGGRITFFQALIRNLFRIIDALPYFSPYLVGLIVLANNDNRQRIGDKVAHTVVVK